jgi:hypothetical protein
VTYDGEVVQSRTDVGQLLPGESRTWDLNLTLTQTDGQSLDSRQHLLGCALDARHSNSIQPPLRVLFCTFPGVPFLLFCSARSVTI